MARTKLYVSIPTTGTVVDSQQFVLRDLEDTYKEHIEFIYPKQCVRRMFHDFARCMQVEDFLDSGADILWFLDSDITPNAHILDLIVLHKDKWQAAGATYPVVMNPLGQGPELVFTCYKKNPETGNMAISAVPTSGTMFVDGLATGCLFIKREVFAKLEKPYFEFKYNPETREMAEGEDLGFCRKLNALGIQFFTDFSLVCNHRKTVDLLDINNYAITYSNRNVEHALEVAKEEATSAVKYAYQMGYKKALEDVMEQTKPKNSGLTTPNKTLWTP
jgi:hypothetical protein